MDLSRLSVSQKKKKPCRIHSFCFFLPLQGFAFTSRDKPGFRPEFLPLTYLAKILSDIEEQGSVSVYILPGLDTEAFGGLRPNVCILCAFHVRAWSKCSIVKVHGRKCVLDVCGVISSKRSCISLASCVLALNPFEEQENVDARFVEETALKQTLILLGFEEK